MKSEKKGHHENKVLVRGIGACKGTAEGIVRIIRNVDDSSKMIEGNVLVTPFTTPLLTLIMAKASAIVTDSGGLTSHAAVIARELGVPCVVGTGNSTKILSDGMKVKVDGGKGVVLRPDAR
jgi:pyruvate,water dikinase